MKPWWRAWRFDALELCLIVAFCGAGFWAHERHTYQRLAYPAIVAAQETAALADRYGTKYSRNEEEWIIRDYFKDRRDGYFVDVGANDYIRESNTYFLETRLGWSGLAIEPQTAFASDYRLHRPRTRFIPLFVSDTSNANVTFFLNPANPLTASSDRGFAERLGTEGGRPLTEVQRRDVPTMRLTDILLQVDAPHLDLLSIDVELAEPKVLAGFDIDRFRPSLVCIEAHARVRQPILSYFAAHGYVALGRYLRADLQNLYFVPLGYESLPLAASGR